MTDDRLLVTSDWLLDTNYLLPITNHLLPTTRSLGYSSIEVYHRYLTITMRTILLITLLFAGMSLRANDPRFLTIRPSMGIYIGKDNSYDRSEGRTPSFSTHLQLELARIKRCQISIGLFTFFKKHDYSLAYSSYSYIHSPGGWSSSSSNTTYNCTLEELTHNATISVGWNSKYIRNRIHFSINGGMMAPIKNTYKVSDITGFSRTSNASSNPIDGQNSSSTSESFKATEKDLRIPQKIESKGTKFFSAQASYLFHSHLELGIEFMLTSQPVRAGNISNHDYNTYYLIRNLGLRLTYNW